MSKNVPRGPKMPDDIAAMTIEQAEAALKKMDSPEGRAERQRILEQRDHFQSLLEAWSERRTHLNQRLAQLYEAALKKNR